MFDQSLAHLIDNEIWYLYSKAVKSPVRRSFILKCYWNSLTFSFVETWTSVFGMIKMPIRHRRWLVKNTPSCLPLLTHHAAVFTPSRRGCALFTRINPAFCPCNITHNSKRCGWCRPCTLLDYSLFPGAALVSLFSGEPCSIHQPPRGTKTNDLKETQRRPCVEHLKLWIWNLANVHQWNESH